MGVKHTIPTINVDIDTSPIGSHPYIAIVGNTYC